MVNIYIRVLKHTAVEPFTQCEDAYAEVSFPENTWYVALSFPVVLTLCSAEYVVFILCLFFLVDWLSNFYLKHMVFWESQFPCRMEGSFTTPRPGKFLGPSVGLSLFPVQHIFFFINMLKSSPAFLLSATCSDNQSLTSSL